MVAGAAHVGCKSLTLERVHCGVATGLPALLERLPEHPLPKNLVALLKDVAEIATEGQLHRYLMNSECLMGGRRC